MKLRLLADDHKGGGVASPARLATGTISSRSGTLRLQSNVLSFRASEELLMEADLGEVESIDWTGDGLRVRVGSRTYRLSFSLGGLGQHPISIAGNARELRDEWRQVIQAARSGLTEGE